MEIDKKTCAICKSKITDEKEYICTACYEKALEKAKHSKFYPEIQKIDDQEQLCAVMLVFALFNDIGE